MAEEPTSRSVCQLGSNISEGIISKVFQFPLQITQLIIFGTGLETAYEIPDVLWDRIVPLSPSHKRKKKAG